MDGEIHFPAVCRAPMPEQDVLTTIPVPVEIHVSPQCIDPGGQPFFFPTAVLIELPDAEQSLQEIAGFHDIAAVVLPSERLYVTRGIVQPVGPCAMETIGFFQEGHDLLKAIDDLLARDILAMDARQD